MRTLSISEIEQAVGGFSILGITEIQPGLNLMTQVRAIAGNAAWSFTLGAAIGSGIYYGYGVLAGDSLGGDLYDLFNC
jgi:hypothetical protein